MDNSFEPSGPAATAHRGIYTYAATSKVAGRTLSGLAHAYGSVTVDGRKHSFAPGAFARSIAAGKVLSFAFHEPSKPLASQKAGNLRLADSKDGLGFEIDLPEGVSYAEDLRQLISSGVDMAMSFSVMPGRSTKVGGGRQFAEAELLSVDPVFQPAFEGTSVALHSIQEPEPAWSQVIKIRLRR